MTRWIDPNFPGLSLALDIATVLEELRGALPECRNDVELLNGTIVDVRYRPHGPCWILYRLKVRRDRQRSTHQLISAWLLRRSEQPSYPSRELLDRFAAHEGNLLSTPAAYIPRLHMAIHAFPLDASLPWLFDACDPSSMRRYLNRLWGEREVRVRDVRIELLGYTPHARAAFLYEVLAECKRTGTPEIRRLIGKMNAKKKAARLFADSWALWRSAGKKISLAPPVGHIPRLNMTLQEQVRGERLGGLASSGAFVKRVRQTARMLAALHRLEIPLFTRRKADTEVYVAERWAGVLASIREDLKPRVEHLLSRMISALEAHACPSAPVHADFHHTNVLVREEGVAIIDFDEMAYGDPMLDVGRFLASLRIPALRVFGSVSGLARAGEAFLSAYLEKAPGDERRVRLFEAASLITAAASAFRIQRPAWGEEVPLLIEEAERVFESAGPKLLSGGPPRPQPPIPIAKDPARWARDEVYMQSVLEPHVREAYGAELTRCRVVMKDPSERGERFLYRLRGWVGDSKWTASLQALIQRGEGRRSFLRRLEVLRERTEESSDLPLLPRPIAYLRPIALLVWEVPQGLRFLKSLEAGDGREAAARVAEALAGLHGTEVHVDKVRSLDDELRRVRKRVQDVPESRRDLRTRAEDLLAEVDARLRSLPQKSAPALCVLNPHHVVLGERVAFTRVEDVVLSHPLFDAADFLARLLLLGLKNGRSEATREAARSFRQAYSQALPDDDACVFEAAALLRLACARTKAPLESQGNLPGELLDEAASRLGARSSWREGE